VIRPSYTLGGTGGGIAYNMEEFTSICQRGSICRDARAADRGVADRLEGIRDGGRARSPTTTGIIVCSIENVDPMGIHTGDSITVAPAQTLTDKEYQLMRDAAIAILREVGVDTGGSNVQFASIGHRRMVVIEMNPRGIALFGAGL